MPSSADAAERFTLLKELVRIEEAEENEEIRSELEYLSPQMLEVRGRALLDLTLEGKEFNPAGHVLGVFARRGRKPLPLFTLETGDVVVLFSAKDARAECPSGTVYEKSPDTLTVAFDRTLPEWCEKGVSCHLHKSLNRVTYKRMLDAIDGVREAHNTRLAELRDISLGVRKARKGNLDARDMQLLDPGLNDSQKKAVAAALEAEDLALVHGPPGTGKTTALVEIIRQHILRGMTVLVNAPSNTACDNILEKLLQKGVNALRLGHPARIDPALREHTLDFRLARHSLAENARELQAELERLFKRQDRYRERRSPGRDAERSASDEIHSLKTEIRAIRREVFDQVLNGAEAVVGTMASAQDKAIRDLEFGLVVIDEATQATEPLSWIPLSRAPKAILAGDHFQLPPTVRSEEAAKRGLSITLFERLHAVLPASHRTLLELQYRMNAAISGFSSREFYGGKLRADAAVRDRTLSGLPGVKKIPETEEQIVFVDTAGKGFEEKLEPGSESRYNPEEGALVLQLLKQLLAAGVPAEEVAVICPYSAQVRWVTAQLNNPKVEVDSVDGFQGREKELVLVSLVRSNVEGEMGFLADTRRMNVAMTRAKRKLVVVGDSATISSIPFYRDFLKYVEESGTYKSAWEIE